MDSGWYSGIAITLVTANMLSIATRHNTCSHRGQEGIVDVAFGQVQHHATLALATSHLHIRTRQWVCATATTFHWGESQYQDTRQYHCNLHTDTLTRNPRCRTAYLNESLNDHLFRFTLLLLLLTKPERRVAECRVKWDPDSHGDEVEVVYTFVCHPQLAALCSDSLSAPATHKK